MIKRKYRRDNEEVDIEISEHEDKHILKIRKKLKVNNKIKSRSVSLDLDYYGAKLFSVLEEYFDDEND